MKLKKTLLVLLTAVAGTLAGTALAQSADLIYTQEHFDALDTNKDGKVSADEYRQFMNQAFDRIDANSDGVLSLDETDELIPLDYFVWGDQNDDGVIDRQEFIDYTMKDFRKADTNNDGYLTFP